MLKFFFTVYYIVGNFISDNMELVQGSSGRSKGRVWRCVLCSFSGGSATVALHINENHLQ